MSSDWAETAAMAIAKTVAKMVAFMTAVCGKIGGGLVGIGGDCIFCEESKV